MDFLGFFRSVWRHKALALAVFFVANLACLLLIVFVTPVYEAEALILVDPGRASSLAGGTDTGGVVLQQDRYLKAQAKIAQSETVLSDALRKVEAKTPPSPRQAPEPTPGSEGSFPVLTQAFRTLVSMIGGEPVQASKEEATAPASAADYGWWDVQKALRVEVEPNTDLLRIVFRDIDPNRASLLANQIAGSLVDRQARLYSNPVAGQFFRDRAESYARSIAERAKRLEAFSVSNQVFAAAEQKKLLLERREKVRADIVATGASTARVQSEIASIKTQLAALRAKINLPPEIFGESAMSARPGRPAQAFGDDPPLLHVQLYQESVKKLVNLNSELAGLHGSERVQLKDLTDVEAQLAVLANHDAEFARLQRELDLDVANADLYAKKSASADAESDWRGNERLSSMQMVQPALVPTRPAFPKPALLVPLGVVVGLMAGFAAAHGAERISNHKSMPVASPETANQRTLSAEPFKSSELRPTTVDLSAASRARAAHRTEPPRTHVREPALARLVEVLDSGDGLRSNAPIELASRRQA